MMMIFLEEIFEKVDFEKKPADDKQHENFPGDKQLKLLPAADQSMLLIQTKVTNLYKKAGGFSCLLTNNIPFSILILH